MKQIWTYQLLDSPLWLHHHMWYSVWLGRKVKRKIAFEEWILHFSISNCIIIKLIQFFVLYSFISSNFPFFPIFFLLKILSQVCILIPLFLFITNYKLNVFEFHLFFCFYYYYLIGLLVFLIVSTFSLPIFHLLFALKCMKPDKEHLGLIIQ